MSSFVAKRLNNTQIGRCQWHRPNTLGVNYSESNLLCFNFNVETFDFFIDISLVILVNFSTDRLGCLGLLLGLLVSLTPLISRCLDLLILFCRCLLLCLLSLISLEVIDSSGAVTRISVGGNNRQRLNNRWHVVISIQGSDASRLTVRLCPIHHCRFEQLHSLHNEH